MWDLYFPWMQGSLSSNSNLDKGLPVLQLSGSQGEFVEKTKQNKSQVFGVSVWMFCFCLGLFFVGFFVCFMCGFSKKGLGTDGEGEGNSDECKMDPTIRAAS